MNERTISNNQLTAYRNHLLQEEHAAATVEKYLRDTGSFAVWLAGRPVTKELVTAWKANLLAEGRAPVTVNAKLSALNGLFRFLGWLECQVRFLKIQRRVFRDAARELRREDYLCLLDAARRSGQERTALLMETICASGIRVSELRYITVEALRLGRCDCGRELVARTAHLRGGHVTSCGCAAHGVEALTYIDGTCVEMLAAKTVRKNNTSGVPGVDWWTSKGRWRAMICFKGKRHYLGSYSRFEDAVKARKEAEERLHDTFLQEYASRQPAAESELGYPDQ